MHSTGIIILAAGNSSRLGRPKQLLPFRGTTMLSHVVAESLKAALQPAVVVTGAYDADIQKSLAGQGVDTVFNPDWEMGMAPGIVTGLNRALAIHPNLQSVIISVCDQPYISAEIFKALMQKHAASRKGLIACVYSDTTGTPVLFDRRYFAALSALAGDAGAKQLLKRYPDDVTTIPFPMGNFDIDTEEDLQRFIVRSGLPAERK